MSKKEEPKAIVLPGHTKITKEMILNLDALFECYPPRVLELTIQEIWGNYLMNRHSPPWDLNKMAAHVYFLSVFFQDAEVILSRQTSHPWKGAEPR